MNKRQKNKKSKEKVRREEICNLKRILSVMTYSNALEREANQVPTITLNYERIISNELANFSNIPLDEIENLYQKEFLSTICEHFRLKGTKHQTPDGIVVHYHLTLRKDQFEPRKEDKTPVVEIEKTDLDAFDRELSKMTEEHIN